MVVGDFIVVADFEGYLHWLSPQDGRIVGRVHAVRDAVAASLVVRDNTIYVLDRGGEVAAVEAKAAN